MCNIKARCHKHILTTLTLLVSELFPLKCPWSIFDITTSTNFHISRSSLNISVVDFEQRLIYGNENIENDSQILFKSSSVTARYICCLI